MVQRGWHILSKSLKLVNLILFRIPKEKDAVQRQLINIQTYPAFRVETFSVAPVPLSRACLISAHAAIIELKTMRPKEKSVRPVTEPPNQRTSP